MTNKMIKTYTQEDLNEDMKKDSIDVKVMDRVRLVYQEKFSRVLEVHSKDECVIQEEGILGCPLLVWARLLRYD